MKFREMSFEKAFRIYEWIKPPGNLGRDWHVFDGNVCVDDNVILKESTFILNAAPVDQVNLLNIIH